MRLKTTSHLFVALLALSPVALGSYGCSKENNISASDDDTTTYNTTNNVSQTVGAQGSSVENPALGARVDIPAGALTKDVSIGIGELAKPGAIPLPAGATAVSRVVSFEPHGQVFAGPVTLSLAHTAGTATGVKLLRADPGGTWAEVDAADTTKALVTRQTTVFSFYVVVTAAGGGGGPITQAEYPAKYADAICGAIGSCCTKVGFSADAGKCTASGDVTGSMAKFQNDSALPGVTFDPTAAADCIKRLRDAVSKCTPAETELDALKDACERVLVGSKPLGTPCTRSVECARPAGPSIYCDQASGQTSMTCTMQTTVASPRGQLGDACRSSCSSQSTNGDDSQCAPIPGTPAPDSAECYVDDGLVCDGPTMKCKAAPKIGDGCERSFECGVSSYCAAGTCAARQGVGGACTANSNEACAGGLYCAGASCAAIKQVGDACADREECPGKCEYGKCIEKGSLASDNYCAPSK